MSGKRTELLASLSRKIRVLEQSQRGNVGLEAVSTGIRALDERLEEGGFPRGRIVEWLGDGPGSGVETLSLLGVREAMRSGGWLVVVDRGKRFGVEGAAERGIALERTIVIHPTTDQLAIWAMEQSLRSRGVAVTWCRMGRMTSEVYRRLQLAAEAGGGLGMLIRDATVRRERCWGEVRVLVRPRASPAGMAGRCVRMELLKARGGTNQVTFDLAIQDDGSVLYLDTELGHPAIERGAVGA